MNLFGMLQQIGIWSEGGALRIPSFAQTIGRGKTWYVDMDNGSATGSATSPRTALNTIPLGYAKMTTGVHDKLNILASPTSLKLATAFDWALNLSHLEGEGAFGRMNQRARVEMSADFATMFTVSGYGNSFSNLYIMHGRASATDLYGLAVTGARNSFFRVHVLPQDSTAVDEANYRLVTINNSENYFKECFFGGDGLLWTNGAAVKLGTSGDGGPPRTIFEDCIFLMKADNNQVRFIDASLAGLGAGAGIFLNCKFINIGTSLTYAINGAGLSNYQLFFDNQCSFVGVTDIVASGYENYVWFGGVNMPIDQVTSSASVALFNGLACHPDVS